MDFEPLMGPFLEADQLRNINLPEDIPVLIVGKSTLAPISTYFKHLDLEPQSDKKFSLPWDHYAYKIIDYNKDKPDNEKMICWNGGYPPEDISFVSKFMLRNGDIHSGETMVNSLRWSHDNEVWDIIGYVPPMNLKTPLTLTHEKAKEIWNQIEAFNHEERMLIMLEDLGVLKKKSLVDIFLEENPMEINDYTKEKINAALDWMEKRK